MIVFQSALTCVARRNKHRNHFTILIYRKDWEKLCIYIVMMKTQAINNILSTHTFKTIINSQTSPILYVSTTKGRWTLKEIFAQVLWESWIENQNQVKSLKKDIQGFTIIWSLCTNYNKHYSWLLCYMYEREFSKNPVENNSWRTSNPDTEF